MTVLPWGGRFPVSPSSRRGLRSVPGPAPPSGEGSRPRPGLRLHEGTEGPRGPGGRPQAPADCGRRVKPPRGGRPKTFLRPQARRGAEQRWRALWFVPPDNKQERCFPYVPQHKRFPFSSHVFSFIAREPSQKGPLCLGLFLGSIRDAICSSLFGVGRRGSFSSARTPAVGLVPRGADLVQAWIEAMPQLCAEEAAWLGLD